MTDISPPRVSSQTNPLYCKPNQLTNPSIQGERVQYEAKAFTKWINSYLQQLSPSARISDLQEDFADGVTLLHFVHQISFEAPPCLHKRPALYLHRLENTEACLCFLDRLGVDVRGAHAEDVARGNLKSILALCRAMYIRFEGDTMENHHCLSSLLSWKHKSPSSSFNASLSSEFTWPRFPWKQGEEMLPSDYQSLLPGEDDSEAGLETTHESGNFTVWYKEDMAVIDWIRRLLGLELKDYSEFADGILLCAIVNQLWEGSITQEEVVYSTSLERLEIATEAAEHFLGVPQTELDLQAVVTGWGRDALPWYLLELKAASERMLQKYLEMEKEKKRSRDEEETVNRMRRHLIRQHSREKTAVASAIHSMTRPTAQRSVPVVRGGTQSHKGTGSFAEMKSSPSRAASSSRKTDPTEQRVSHMTWKDARKNRIPDMSQKTKLVQSDPYQQRSSSKPSIPRFQGHHQNSPDDAPVSSTFPEDETLGAVEQLETSLASLMQDEEMISPTHQQGRQTAPEVPQICSDTPPVPRNPYPSPAAPPRSVTSAKRLQQPDVATFFSPYSMPFVSIATKVSSASRFCNPSQNSASSVFGDDSLTRGKLTSWSDKDVREGQNKDRPSREAELPLKPPGHISATMLARLAARSPAGIVGVRSSDSDDE
ncbi:uncharacterized protein LOC110987666 isoform X2 [Acanthaster planci]|uniref:Uncharacterized protein LOC110987666 isoform X2 n=1 Tax=Acanthaster planci TaxID=133434 RepID=A0A8B7ZS53_ACAPL|nr:uncharacterized protein LOC110987666 isoform X2 [Acanthaster planci]